MRAIEELSYDDWRHFKRDFVADLFRDGCFRREEYIFRGQMKASWSLVSTFDRWFHELTESSRPTIAQRLIDGFRQEAISRGAAAPVNGNERHPLFWPALARHYGVPTRILDWSASPYVAAFFAFSDAVFDSRYDQPVAIWALRCKSAEWEERGVEVCCAPQALDVRIQNQNGWFTLSRAMAPSVDGCIDGCERGDVLLQKFVIPVEEARIALTDLDIMGINHAQLFPGLEGCARAAHLRTMLDTSAG